MVHGETTKRSPRDAETSIAPLQAHGVAQLPDEAAIWVLVDGAALRKPHARTMEGLPPVKRLHGAGMLPGARTLNAIGVGRQRRGRRYQQLFSSTATGFLSESAETQPALPSVGTALAGRPADSTDVCAAGFDDVAVWATVWTHGHHLVCRVQHRDRLVRPAVDQPPCHLDELAPHCQLLARVEPELVVRTGTPPRPKVQPGTARSAAVPLVVADPEAVRTRADGAQHDRPVWLVAARLEGAHEAPWWRLTDRPVTTAEAATAICRMYRQRWAIEDVCKIGKQGCGWEAVQVLTLVAVRTLVALGWVAAGFLSALGVTLAWPEVRLLTRRSGGERRAHRPPGKPVLTRGLRRLLALVAAQAILANAVRQYGGLPPRRAARRGPRSTH